MIRSEYPKKFNTCCAIARASSSFMPARSMLFRIARVRSSTVRVPRGPGSVLVWIAMNRPSRVHMVGTRYLYLPRRRRLLILMHRLTSEGIKTLLPPIALGVSWGGPGEPPATDGAPRHEARGGLHRRHREAPDGARGRRDRAGLADDHQGIPDASPGEGGGRPRGHRSRELPVLPCGAPQSAPRFVPLLHVPSRPWGDDLAHRGGGGPERFPEP